ncbi:MAG: TonB-dependent receptor [Alphaproteobacteria bacterium]|nr:TonB-dependent receptor [Alphaproteobacteria bacterium]
MSVLALCSHPALAQDQGSGSSTEAANVGQIETVIVTATRTRENELNVPVAITAFSQNDLDQKNIQTANDLQNFVPSLDVLTIATAPDSFTIRGIGPTGNLTGGGPGGGPGVVAYLAEAPTNAGGPGVFFDLESLQVLKGPQGTLFGRNTTGGAVLMEPVRPSNEFGGYADAILGDFGRMQYEAAVNVPVLDWLSFRVAGMTDDQTGYTRDIVTNIDYNDRHSRSFRLGVLAKPFEGFENYLVAQYVYYNQHGAGYVLVAADPNVEPALMPYLALQQVRGPSRVSYDYPEVQKSRALDVVDNASWEVVPDLLTIKNVFSYSHYQNNGGIDADASPLAVADLTGADPGGWSDDRATFTEDFHLQGHGLHDGLTWQAGAYFEYTHNPGPQTYNIDFLASLGYLVHQDRKDDKARSRAYYGQATLDLGALSPAFEGINLTAGYRYTWDYVYEGVSSSGTIPGVITGLCVTGPAPLASFLPNCFQANSSNSSGASWTLGVDYHTSDRTMLYMRASQGYKSGGFNASVPTNNVYYAYKPEKALDVELGVKSEFEVAGMPARVDLDAFHTDYNDVQRSVYATVLGLPLQITSNAASATIQGIELAATVIPIDPVTLSVTYSSNDAHYNRYITPIGQDFTDHPFEYTPKHKVSVDARYKLPFDSSWGELTLGGTVSYQSKMVVADDVEPFDTISGYMLANLRLDWTRGDWGASVFVTNVGNKTYRILSNPTYISSGLVSTVYGEPRMVGIELHRNF